MFSNLITIDNLICSLKTPISMKLIKSSLHVKGQSQQLFL